MTTPTTTIEVIAAAVKAARAGDIDTCERMFDVVAGWMISPEDKNAIDCIIADCCAIADGRDGRCPHCGDRNPPIGGRCQTCGEDEK